MAFFNRSRLAPLFIGPVLLSLIGCSGLPSAAPTASQVEGRQDENFDIVLVKTNPKILSILAASGDVTVPQSLRQGSFAPSVALRPGDMIAVNVYETGGPSLFGATVSGATGSSDAMQGAPHATTIPPQIIESNGQIAIPFVGRVNVAGQTPLQAAKHIETLLAEKALQPQVVVSLVSNGTNNATVGGDANKPGQIPLTLRGERLLDVIATAGGTRFSEFDTDVRIMRGKTTATISLMSLHTNPANNVLVAPNDQIILLHNPKTYSVLGAAQKVSQYPLDQVKVTLAEAMARAGGSIDTVGDLSAIYVFRTEDAETVRAILRTGDVIDPASPRVIRAEAVTGPMSVMYKIDLSQAGGYFLAQTMKIRDKDIILVTDSQGTQLLKIFTILRGASGIVYDLKKTSSL